jgi:hypothetical protein
MTNCAQQQGTLNRRTPHWFVVAAGAVAAATGGAPSRVLSVKVSWVKWEERMLKLTKIVSALRMTCENG